MKIVKLPIKALDLTYEEMEKYEGMNIPLSSAPMEDVTLYVNVDHIVAFNRDSNDNTTLYLSGQDAPYMIYMQFNEFLDLIGL